MLTNGRAPDQIFDPKEMLYRRAHPRNLVEGVIELDAVNLPDMSVVRDKYCENDPAWALDDPDHNRTYPTWGVIAFPVEGIPRMQSGAFKFRAVHDPLAQNYPHTEVRAFTWDDLHIRDLEKMDPSIHLDFRTRLLENARIAMPPLQPESAW
jgi:hypothetical protein